MLSERFASFLSAVFAIIKVAPLSAVEVPNFEIDLTMALAAEQVLARHEPEVLLDAGDGLIPPEEHRVVFFAVGADLNCLDIVFRFVEKS